MEQTCSADAPVSVLIHPSQFPAEVVAAMRESLRTRRMNHKFHYDTPKQTQQWLRLHEALSPARTDPDCGRIYEEAFQAAADQLDAAREIEIISLGCGGGQKDAQLIRVIRSALPDARLRYVAADVSVGLTLTSRSAAMAAGLPSETITPLAIDLGRTRDWSAAFAGHAHANAQRLVCFFGMLPNFLPSSVMPKLASLLRPQDTLLVSANLAPGLDYAAGVRQVLPLYENDLTRDWLWTVLLDLGISRDDGEMQFTIADSADGEGLLRIESNVVFTRPCSVKYAGEKHKFRTGEMFGLFYSYRHTPLRLKELLAKREIGVVGQWVNRSGEEGVFLCQKGRR